MEREERERRRDTFLADAQDYAAVRPEYPGEALEAAVELAGLTPGDRVLEIGCGTGQATRWFGERGYPVLALDRSREMADYTARRLAGLDVEVRCVDFETLVPDGTHAAVLAATSFHWLDPDDRVARCAAHLVPGGGLILLWHTHPRPFTGFFERVQPIYERVVPGWTPPPSPGMIEERIEAVCAELGSGALFERPERRGYDWARTYSRGEYERLLRTYSDHMLLPLARRETIVRSVGELIDDEFDGRITRPYRTELVVARRPL